MDFRTTIGVWRAYGQLHVTIRLCASPYGYTSSTLKRKFPETMVTGFTS